MNDPSLFPHAPRRVTIDDMIRCAERELAMRRAYYPKRVADRKMRQETADHEIDAQEAIVETLKKDKERGEIAVRLSGNRSCDQIPRRGIRTPGRSARPGARLLASPYL